MFWYICGFGSLSTLIVGSPHRFQKWIDIGCWIIECSLKNEEWEKGIAGLNINIWTLTKWILFAHLSKFWIVACICRLSFLGVLEQLKCPKSNLRRGEGTESGTTGSTTSDSFPRVSVQEGEGTTTEKLGPKRKLLIRLVNWPKK